VNSISGSMALDPDMPRHRIRDLRTEALAGLIQERSRQPIRRLLVVGCGSGKEAAVLAGTLAAKTVGIDIAGDFDPDAAAFADLRVGDATRLDFPDRTFDFVYSYHTLEHIPDHMAALGEMRRVLVDGGGFCIGTPNRLRLLAYFGSPGVSLREKIRWNVVDWKARLRGRFRNEYGAHAGFSSAELKHELQRVFGNAEKITLPYYLRVYRNHAALCRLLDASGLGQILYPCVYFVGRKERVRAT
jgi:SAM-dependent methyltransferase